MRVDATTRDTVLKLVYCGPGFSGKTSNLNSLRAALGSLAGELIAEDHNSERTLRLDVTVAQPLATSNRPVRLELVTVPGQSYYAATRRAVLDGADGIVFVADSRREAMDENIESMNEMLANLRQMGLGDDLPVVIQYNKQDLPTAVKREQLDPLMNVRSWPSFTAVAELGTGVIETLRVVVERMLARMPATPPPVSKPRTWLISCHRCQAMLEVPDAAVGKVYTCGVCATAMEIADTERGITRPPVGVPRDDSAYGMQQLPELGESALRVTPTGGNIQIDAGQPFILPGYTVAGLLDTSPQGQRMRVTDQNGRTFRALVLNPNLLRQPGYYDNVESYARMGGQVHHPNALGLVGSHLLANEQVVFLSPDPGDFEPLSVILSRRRALAPPHAMGILRQIALVLEESARQGVVHGWLRPDVVLVNPNGDVKLDELCVPKVPHFLVRELASDSAGAEYFLAPEYLGEDARADVRTDIFLLGALMFRLLTGEGLITGYNAHDALHKLLTNGARSLRSVQPSISRDLDLFYLRMVATDRRERIQTYGELINLFDKFGGGAQRQALQLTKRTTTLGLGGPSRMPMQPAGLRAGVGPGGPTPLGSRMVSGMGPGMGTGGGMGPGMGTGGNPVGGRPSTAGPGFRPGPPISPVSRPPGTHPHVRPPGTTKPRRNHLDLVLVVCVVAVLALAAVAVVMLLNRPPVPAPAAPTHVAPAAH